MNYLAHLYLAEGTAESLIGSLMGDFVRGTELGGYPAAVAEGIRLHRRVDAFTDRHPVVVESKRRLSPGHRRYGGILIDVFYDHFLARDWARYAPSPLAEFTAQVYAALEAHAGVLPERLRAMTPRMAAEDWLGSYAEVEGIRSVLGRVSRRLSRPHPLADAIADLQAQYEALGEDFTRFFPDLVAHARTVPTAEALR